MLKQKHPDVHGLQILMQPISFVCYFEQGRKS